MRAVVLSGPNQFAPAEIEKPQIGPDEILLEMKAAAICGTDMRILTGKKTKGVRYPSVIGHEFCGVIAEVGADVKGYEVGEKVAVANVIPCHHCSSWTARPSAMSLTAALRSIAASPPSALRTGMWSSCPSTYPIRPAL